MDPMRHLPNPASGSADASRECSSPPSKRGSSSSPPGRGPRGSSCRAQAGTRANALIPRSSTQASRVTVANQGRATGVQASDLTVALGGKRLCCAAQSGTWRVVTLAPPHAASVSGESAAPTQSARRSRGRRYKGEGTAHSTAAAWRAARRPPRHSRRRPAPRPRSDSEPRHRHSRGPLRSPVSLPGERLPVTDLGICPARHRCVFVELDRPGLLR